MSSDGPISSAYHFLRKCHLTNRHNDPPKHRPKGYYCYGHTHIRGSACPLQTENQMNIVKNTIAWSILGLFLMTASVNATAKPDKPLHSLVATAQVIKPTQDYVITNNESHKWSIEWFNLFMFMADHNPISVGIMKEF